MAKLRQQIEKASASLTNTVHVRAKLKDAEHLARVRDLAILIIDAQDEFCSTQWNFGKGTKELEQVCENIAQLAPIFRNAGIKIYGIYSSEFANETPSQFCRWQPTKKDTLIQKFSDSAFLPNPLFGKNRAKEILKKDGKNRLLVLGAYTSDCINRTVKDGLKLGFDVYVAKDLVYDRDTYRYTFNRAYGGFKDKVTTSAKTNHQKGLKEMKKAGAKIITSKQALKMFVAQT